MKRILCVWLPDWPIQRRVVSRRELGDRPIVLYRRAGGVQRVAVCSSQAAAHGVRFDMPLVEATSLLRRRRGRLATWHLEVHDPAADRATLERLAGECERFSPLVGLEEVAEPECLLADLTGLDLLFGGEPALVQKLHAALTHRGWTFRTAVAPTVGAAWAAARNAGPACLHVDEVRGTWPATFDPYPVATLRLPPATLDLLAQLGVERIEQLRQLPRQSLSARFGPALLERIDQFEGRAAEPIVACRIPQRAEACWTLEHPIDRSEAVAAVLKRLVEQLTEQLQRRNQGVVRLCCRIACVDRPTVRIDVGLFQPTVAATHLLELIELQLAGRTLPGPVGGLAVCATSTAPLQAQQRRLFDRAAEDRPRQLALLVDRLSSRLGRQRVVQARLQRDAQPERAWRRVPLAGRRPSRSRSRRAAAGAAEVGALHRPLRLIDPPARLETLSVAPDGPPIQFCHAGRLWRVARHEGPERIETGWWRGRSICRDYWRVETEQGCRFWLFRRLDDGAWFLQGEFG